MKIVNSELRFQYVGEGLFHCGLCSCGEAKFFWVTVSSVFGPYLLKVWLLIAIKTVLSDIKIAPTAGAITTPKLIRIPAAKEIARAQGWKFNSSV